TLSYTLSLHDALPILFQRGPEDLQLDAQGAVHGRGAHDVALHAVPVAGEREGVGVDAAGAVDERVAGPDGTGLQETAHRSQGRVDLHGLEAQADQPGLQRDEIRSLDRLRDVRVHTGRPVWSATGPA